MENAPLIGLSRQIALRRELNVVANNLANLNTFGFKAEKLLFEDYIMPVASDQSFPVGSQEVHYVQDLATMHDFKPGAFQQTGSTFDIALEGPGFLTVETPNGIAYTRNGALHTDASGTLVTVDGDPVLAGGGTITFAPGETDIRIAPNGAVITSAGNKGQLSIVEFDDPQTLIHLGSSLYKASDTDPGRAATETNAHQGMIETSNVSGIGETAEMIRINRAYEIVSQLIKRQDELRQTAIRRLGDVTA